MSRFEKMLRVRSQILITNDFKQWNKWIGKRV